MKKTKEVQLSFRADPLRSFIAAVLAMAYFLCAGGVAWSDSSRTDHIIQIIHSGQSAPMQESLSRRFGGFSAPKINDQGDIAFVGFIRGTGILQSNDEILWLDRHDDNLRPLAREGSAAPGGGPDFRYLRVGLSAASLNNDGRIAFRGEFANPSGVVTTGRAIWRTNEQDEFDLVARTGVQPPGLSNAAVFTGTMESPGFNDSGATAFTGQFNDPQITPQQIRGVWSDFGGVNGLGLIAYSGQSIPGTQTPLDLGQNDDFFLSEDGDLAWISHPQSALDDQAIITKPRGEPWRVIARVGDTMPTINPAAVISGVSASDINASGELAVRVRVDGGPCSGCTYIGVMSIEGDFRVAARRNLTAPGTQSSFVDLGPTSVDDSGRVAFTATTAGTTARDSGLWMEYPAGDLRLIAREGDVPPGVDSGLVYGHFGIGAGAPAFNGAGHMAFMRNLTEPGSSIASGRGIWIHDEINGVRPVIITGDILPDQFGVMREVIALEVPFVQGSSAGEGSWINRHGQVIFIAHLDNDSSGIFVSNLAVPEPSSIGALCGAALVCVVARHRGRKQRIAS
jgi:hypothetical protein